MKFVLISLFLLKLVWSQEIQFPDEQFSQPLLYQTQQYFGESNEKLPVFVEEIQPRNNPISDNNDDESDSRTSHHRLTPKRVLKKVKRLLRRKNLWRSINPSVGRNADEIPAEKTDPDTESVSVSDDSMPNNYSDDDEFSKINITDFYDSVNPVELLETLLAQRENIDLQIQHIMQLRNAERKLRGQSDLKEPNFTICGKVQTQDIVLDGNNLPKKPIGVEFSGGGGAQVLLNRLVGVKMDCSCSFGRQTNL